MSYGIVTVEDTGRNGITKKDVGKYWVMCDTTRVIYIRKDKSEASQLDLFLKGFK